MAWGADIFAIGGQKIIIPPPEGFERVDIGDKGMIDFFQSLMPESQAVLAVMAPTNELIKYKQGLTKTPAIHWGIVVDSQGLSRFDIKSADDFEKVKSFLKMSMEQGEYQLRDEGPEFLIYSKSEMINGARFGQMTTVFLVKEKIITLYFHDLGDEQPSAAYLDGVSSGWRNIVLNSNK